MGPRMRVLLVDDDPESLKTLRHLFETAGFGVAAAPSAETALEVLEAHPVDLVLTDHWMPGRNGLELLEELRAHPEAPPVLVMSERASTSLVVLAMRGGAAWFLDKPLDVGELTAAVRAALGERFEGSFRDQDAPHVPVDPLPEIVGVSTCIRNVKQLVRAAARTSSSVFIEGATGTGKELVARSIHRLSARADGPFIAVNCGALPEGLAESELFGAEKGAYTGAGAARRGLIRAAEGGTLFLDELGEMPLELQVKLLRVLQQKAVRTVGGTEEVPIDVRIIAATNRDPEEAVRQGSLRQDLYYRLVVLRISLEPLASRPEDIPPLVAATLEELRESYGGGPRGMSGPALEAMRRHPWLGNVRELQNVLDLIFALGASGDEIQLGELPERIRAANPDGSSPPDLPPEPDRGPDERPLLALKEAEHQMIRRALEKAGGNKAKAARMLGISRQALYRRLEDLDIEA